MRHIKKQKHAHTQVKKKSRNSRKIYKGPINPSKDAQQHSSSAKCRSKPH